MSPQNWIDNCFDLDNSGHSDLTNIENNFACLRSMFSGSSAPSSPVAGMPWLDTSNKILKIRNADNDAWLGVFYGTINQICLFFRNDAEEGWIIDSTNTDRVVAVKGDGSTYITGGTTAGSWTISGLTASNHTHSQSHNHAASGGGHAHVVSSSESIYYEGPYVPTACGHEVHTHTSSLNSTATGNSSTLSFQSAGTWRPAACVSTVQYMDI